MAPQDCSSPSETPHDQDCPRTQDSWIKLQNTYGGTISCREVTGLPQQPPAKQKSIPESSTPGKAINGSFCSWREVFVSGPDLKTTSSLIIELREKPMSKARDKSLNDDSSRSQLHNANQPALLPELFPFLLSNLSLTRGLSDVQT